MRFFVIVNITYCSGYIIYNRLRNIQTAEDHERRSGRSNSCPRFFRFAYIIYIHIAAAWHAIELIKQNKKKKKKSRDTKQRLYRYYMYMGPVRSLFLSIPLYIMLSKTVLFLYIVTLRAC